MNIKYFYLVFVLFAFLPLVSAQYYYNYFGSAADQLFNSITQNLEPLFRFVLGGERWDGYLLFEKLLLTLLIVSVSYLSLKRVPVFREGHKGILRLISVIVGVLGVRNLDRLWLETIFVQYQVVFILIAIFVPFLIVWGFLSSLDPWAKKIGWIFYLMVYLGLSATTSVAFHKEVYVWTALAVFVYAFFLETPLLNWINRQKAYQAETDEKLTKIARINRSIQDLERTPLSRHFTQNDQDRLIDRLSKLRDKLSRHL